ncbi:hypothetical protein ACR6C2_03745 [Streptomyces sp. INA 01156]
MHDHIDRPETAPVRRGGPNGERRRGDGRPGSRPPSTARRGERPFIVIWESTRACPLACLHCRAEAVPDRDPRELDTAAACDLLRQVAAFGQPAPLFVITGGDPFQRPDLTELITYGRQIGSGSPCPLRHPHPHRGTAARTARGRSRRTLPQPRRVHRRTPRRLPGVPGCSAGPWTPGTRPAPSA